MTTENTEQTTTDASQTTEETGVSSTPQTESAAPDTQQDTVSKKDFNKLYWEKKQAQRELQELKTKHSENAEHNQTVPNTPDTGKNNAPDTGNEPTLEQFDFDSDAYTTALVNYRVSEGIKQAFDTRDKQTLETKQQNENLKISQDFNERYASYISENPEYEELSKSGAKIFSPHINQAILYADNGPAVDHYLLNNPLEAERISNLNPVTAALEVGRISAELRTQTKQINTSNAPVPIETVGGGGANVKDIRYDENSSMADYYRTSMAIKRGG